MRATLLFVSALLTFSASETVAVRTVAPMDLEVARADHAGERPRVIIAYRTGSEARLRASLQHDTIRDQWPGAFVVDLTSRTAQELARHPDVLNISADATVSGQQLSTTSGALTQDIQNLRATLGISATQTGAGVGIAIIDSGVVPSPDVDAAIINISLGHPILEPAILDPLVQAVERASAAGIIVVAAAGNFGTNPTTGEIGYAGLASPGNARSAITVGAVNTFKTVSRASSGATTSWGVTPLCGVTSQRQVLRRKTGPAEPAG
jgi:subtilisin family serine protease